ncbi:MAG: EcsC family protein [Candidatus Methylumidiphilus sp.]
MNPLRLPLNDADARSLIQAHRQLEHPSFAGRLSSVVGTPIEMAMKLLPRPWCLRIQHAAEDGIGRALDVAVARTRNHAPSQNRDRRYQMLGMASGAVGGFFGGPALLLELPVTTTLMLSAIVDIARSHGEDADDLATRLACMEVFALGGRSNLDDAAETGYYGLRLALELPIASASRFLSRPGAAMSGDIPVLVNLIRALAERFGVVLSQKAVAEIIPIIGAAGGAFINHVFIQHFQDMAHGHFTVRRLERHYGPAIVRDAYERIGHHANLRRTPALPNRRPARIGAVAA